MRYILTLYTITVFYFCSYGQDNPVYSIYLVGDAGDKTEGNTGVISTIESQLKGNNESIIYLGDNIYQHGMPPENSPERPAAEASINAQLALAKQFKGKAYFIPGNHDWGQGRKYGWSQVIRQENYIEDRLDSADIFMPDNGCPGPVTVQLAEDILLVIMDTQWFLHGWDKPDGEVGGCEFSNPVEVLQAFENVLAMNTEKKIVVATHHPMITYGEHGGVFPSKLHFLPPVLGSIYPLYRFAFGSVQDLANPKYKAMKNAMMTIMETYPNVVHAAGHEHSLQYSTKNNIHYIVSGAGSRTTYVKQKGFSEYAESVNGFSKLNFYSNGDVKLEFYNYKGEKTFSKPLFNKPYVPKLTAEEFAGKYDLKDSTMVLHASDQYKAGSGHKKMFGANYRDVWEQDIEVPVFDIGSEHGGLKIVQRGGGQQTKSLRLEAKDGKQYVLRSIEKYAAGAIPSFLRNTFAQDLVQDQISASHPYGAFVVPYIADAAGIYHTNPKLVLIPDDPRFGKHQITFANTLALYEERPAHDWSNADYFGNSPDIESTSKVLESLQKDNDHYVDQKFVLKSRLFDMVIGDWDRHDDQWRWSEIDEGKGNRYRPIPRDRDQAFFVNEGFFPSIWKRKWGLPKFEGFDEDIDWPSGLSFNARYFDRSFLTSLEKQDWIETAEELKKNLTDEKIEAAIKKWPKPIYDLHGEEVIKRLKARRDKLTDYAISHYLFLAKAVDVVGSDKHEHIKVERKENGDVHVKMKKMQKDGDKKHTMYERTFHPDETKEIRIYALGGDDEIEIEGEGKKGIKVRVIGGEGKDELDDDSKVSGLCKQNIFYDTEEGNKLKLNKESKNKLSNDPAVNIYNRKEFQYNVLMPLLTANFNPDDGVFLGGGFVYTNHGFRKDPFKSKHKVLGSYALNTSSYNFSYLGQYTDVIGKWGLETSINMRAPNFVNNFFGMGNDSKFDQNIDQTVDVNNAINYYRLRFEEYAYEVGIFRPIGSLAKLGITHDFVSWELNQNDNDQRFVTDVFLNTTDLSNETTVAYMGGGLRLDVDTRKNPNNPTSGIFWTNKLSTLYGIERASDDFHQYNTSLSLYHSFKIPARLTFAARVGWGMNFGDYPFFRGQTLGGKEQVRGYRKTRFYGDEVFYTNFEARLKLFSFKSYILPSSFGILGFHDVGRVWLDGEDSDKWHRGVGGGIWLTPFNMVVLSFEVAASEEETLPYVRMGFLF